MLSIMRPQHHHILHHQRAAVNYAAKVVRNQKDITLHHTYIGITSTTDQVHANPPAYL